MRVQHGISKKRNLLLFGKGRELGCSLPRFSELLTVLYEQGQRAVCARANFVAPLICLKGCVADELGRNRMWIYCGGMIAVDTDFHAFCNRIFFWAAAVGDCSPMARKRHSLKKWALASCQANRICLISQRCFAHNLQDITSALLKTSVLYLGLTLAWPSQKLHCLQVAYDKGS